MNCKLLLDLFYIVVYTTMGLMGIMEREFSVKYISGPSPYEINMIFFGICQLFYLIFSKIINYKESEIDYVFLHWSSFLLNSYLLDKYFNSLTNERHMEFVVLLGLRISFISSQKLFQSFNENDNLREKMKGIYSSLLVFIVLFSFHFYGKSIGIEFQSIKPLILLILSNCIVCCFLLCSKRGKKMDFRLRKVIGGFLFTFILWFVFLSLVISRSLESKWQMINPAFFCTCLFGMFFEDFLMFKKKQHFTEREFEEEVFCVICQELTTEGVVLKCNHSFHEKCLSDWTTRSSKCPLCMTKIEEKKEEEVIV